MSDEVHRPANAAPAAHPPLRTAAPELPASPRILAIRLSAMGDVLLCFPAVRALRRAYPDARLTFLTDRRFAPLLAGLDDLDATLTLDRSELRGLRPSALLRFWRETLRPSRGAFDAVIDLQSFGETAMLARFTGAPVRVSRRYKTGASWLYTTFIDVPHPPSYMTVAHLDTLTLAGLVPQQTAAGVAGEESFSVASEDRAEWRQRTSGPGTDPDAGARIALFVGAARAEKRWPPAAFAELAARLDRAEPERDLRFVVLAGPAEQPLATATADALAAAGLETRTIHPGPVSLQVLGAALAEAALTVSNDTGPMHLSVATGTPTVALFHRRLEHFTPPPPHRWVEAPADGATPDIEVTTVEHEVAALLGG